MRLGGKGRRSGITLPPFTLNGEGGPPWGVLVLPELKPGVLLITHYSAITRAQIQAAGREGGREVVFTILGGPSNLVTQVSEEACCA